MVGCISHDLRTPLNGISMLLNCVLQSRRALQLPNELINKYIQPSLYCCEHLTCLINDILDFAQEEFDTEPRVDYSKVDIRKEMLAVDSIFKMRSNTRKITWTCTIDKLVPREFNTDPKRLKQILFNLIGNSMKFTFKGFIKVNIKLVKVNGKDAIKFSIIDSGLGISPDKQSKIFELFSIVESDRKVN